MRYPGFVGPTYTLRSPFMSADRCVNLYPELNELQNAKNREIGTLVGRAGEKLLATLGTGPIRGMYFTSTGRLLVVSGYGVYRVDSDWSYVLAGSLATSSGPVSIADNGLQAMIVDGAHGYIITFATAEQIQISSDGFSGADRVTFQDGYFIINNPGTGQFGLSALYDGTSWDPLDFATAEGEPDNLLCGLSNNRQLWLFGTQTIEVWWNTGDADFPFARIDGAFIAIGCGATFTPQKFANTVIWLSDQGIVYSANGFSPQRISNLAVELAIKNSGDFSAATAWSYTDNGHWFYCLDIPGLDSTWVYDLSTGQWHERTWTDGNGVESKQRGRTYALAYDTHVVGDFENGNIYALDMDTYSDNGSIITRTRTAPHLSQDLQRIFVSQAQLDMQIGVGLDGTTQGTDPQVMLRVSRDGGFNWGNERWVSAGKIGNTRARAIWRRLGQGRDIMMEVKMTDPVRPVILGMELLTDVGNP